MYRVTAISMGSPAQVTVANYQAQAAHALTDGQMVYLHEVPGCQAANGYRYAGAATGGQGNGTFTLYANPALTSPVQCAEPFNATFQSGYVGPVQDYTLNSGLRARLFIPQSGAVFNRVTDTSAEGGNVGLAAINGNPAYAGLITRLTPLAASCCGAASFGIKNSQSARQSAVEGDDARLAALLWYANNSNASQLALAKYELNNVENLMEDGGNHPRPGFACDQSSGFCGLGSGDDWLSITLANLAQAYDLVKNQMTPTERATFRDKMLNGYDGALGTCTNQIASTPTGTVTTTAGSTAITGSGFRAYGAGDWIYIKYTKKFGPGGAWYKIASVTDDAHASLDSTVGLLSWPGADHYRVGAWQPGNCGMLWATYGHNYTWMPYSRWWSSLRGAASISDSTITVTSMADLGDTPPYYISVDGEMMLVTAVQDTTLSVLRGQLYSTAASHASGATLCYARAGLSGSAVKQVDTSTISQVWGAGPFAIAGDWRHNLLAQKLVGALMIGLALADEDARAADLAERAWNYYYDLTYTYNRDVWSGTTQGGFQFGYRWGRWTDFHLNAAIAAEYAFTKPNSLFGQYWWRTLISPWMDAVPYSWTVALWDGIGLTSNSGNITPSSMEFVAAAQTFNSGQALTARADYYYKKLAGFWTPSTYTSVSGARGAPFVMAFMDGREPALDPRSSNPWWFYTENDYDYLGGSSPANTYMGLFVSKSDWTPNASMVFSALGFSNLSDHSYGNDPAYAGSYNVIKGAKTLIGGNGSNAIAYSRPDSNSFQMGVRKVSNDVPAWFIGNPDTSDGGEQNQIDRKIGNAGYVYARGNFTNSYINSNAVTLSLRSFLHLKGPAEYVVVFDNHAASSSLSMSTNIHYYRQDEPTAVFNANASAATVQFIKAATTDINHRTVAPAMVSTKLLFPGGPVPTLTPDAACAGSSCTLAVNWGTVNSAQMITVHRVAQSTNDQLPDIHKLALVDVNHVGVEINDGNNSYAILYSSNGQDQTTAEFSTSLTGHVTCLLTELAQGAYSVYRGGVLSLAAVTVVDDGTLMFDCSGGPAPWRVAPSSVPAPLQIETKQLPAAQVGLYYSSQLNASGGVPPYTWSVVGGPLPEGLSLNPDGTISGVPEVLNPYEFVYIQATDHQAPPKFAILAATFRELHPFRIPAI